MAVIEWSNTGASTGIRSISSPIQSSDAVQRSDSVYWIGALDPALRVFDIIFETANGASYNAYLVRGNERVAVIDTVKAEFSDDFFTRLESVARYDEIKYIILIPTPFMHWPDTPCTYLEEGKTLFSGDILAA